MEEKVGVCRSCGKEIFCRDGFLDGVVEEDKSLRCFACHEREGPAAEDRKKPTK